MLYLTHRPQTFRELDSAAVTSTLLALLSGKTVPHAILFTGQKGMGKTSSARIVAKSVNCLENSFAKKSSSIEPCNNCINCLAIQKGSSPDVVEMDAASNRGIDDIKNLIKDADLLPMQSRYRVFIIDECHMITPDAFNALLKTLEEPPKSTLFILATTNKEKLPKTIISRCIEVNFPKATEEDIVKMLQKVLKKEQKALSIDLLITIAKFSDHSFRDANKILEEVLLKDIKTIEDIKKIMGVTNNTSLLSILKDGEKATLQYIENYTQSQGNIKELIEQTLRELHDITLAHSGIRAHEFSKILPLKDVMKLIKALHVAYEQTKYTPIEQLPLEIAILEYYNAK